MSSAIVDKEDELKDSIGEELYTALLNMKDRIYILKQYENIEKFMKSDDTTTDIPTQNSYHKLILIKIINYFKLSYSTEPSKLGVLLIKTTNSVLPDKNLSELVPLEVNQQSNVKIITRQSSSPQASTSPSATPALPRDTTPKSLHEREQAYQEARSRIFTNLDSTQIAGETELSMLEQDGDSNREDDDDEFGYDDIPRDLSRLPSYQYQQQQQQQQQIQAQIFQAQAQAAFAASTAALSAQQQQQQQPQTNQFWNPWMRPNVFLPPNPTPFAFPTASTVGGVPPYRPPPPPPPFLYTGPSTRPPINQPIRPPRTQTTTQRPPVINHSTKNSLRSVRPTSIPTKEQNEVKSSSGILNLDSLSMNDLKSTPRRKASPNNNNNAKVNK
ncbi:hypothetical protein E3Q19_01975 [Wallemia mellicola]|nr:hypothetical protein E3Q19_01975 [Wallemia mellicola]TIC56444.1 hypothetical protein E3Q05_01736 [Wallemia mellicola]